MTETVVRKFSIAEKVQYSIHQQLTLYSMNIHEFPRQTRRELQYAFKTDMSSSSGLLEHRNQQGPTANDRSERT